MYFVYVLFSLKDSRLYIGFCSNIESRFARHQAGYVPATMHRRPLILIYYEAYQSEPEAKRRERYLKGGNGRAQLKIQLSETFKNIGYKFL